MDLNCIHESNLNSSSLFQIPRFSTLRANRRAAFPEKPHSSFCSPFSLGKFLAAASNHSSCTTGQGLSHAEASSSLWRRSSPTQFQPFLFFAFLSFDLKDIFYYSHPQDGKASRLSCLFPAYLSHLLRIKAF